MCGPLPSLMKIRKKHIITFSCFGLGIAAIALFGNFLPGGEISLIHSQEDQFHVVEVQTKNLAHPFFGTSFYLTYNPNHYEYDHFSLGSFFEDTDPLVQVAPKDDLIIIGLSLKRGSIIKKPEGTLIKLFFTNKSHTHDISNFSLKKGIYSTFDNGRKDISSVKFSQSTINN